MKTKPNIRNKTQTLPKCLKKNLTNHKHITWNFRFFYKLQTNQRTFVTNHHEPFPCVKPDPFLKNPKACPKNSYRKSYRPHPSSRNPNRKILPSSSIIFILIWNKIVVQNPKNRLHPSSSNTKKPNACTLHSTPIKKENPNTPLHHLSSSKIPTHYPKLWNYTLFYAERTRIARMQNMKKKLTL